MPIDTGERLTESRVSWVTLEHLHRYAMAARVCAGQDVLDIASGEGYGSNYLSAVARTVTGIDLSQDAVRHAKAKYSRPNLRYLAGAAQRIPLGSARVDVAVSFETLEHHDRHDEMMAELKRVLRPGGLLFLSTPDRRNYSDIPKHRNASHVKELYREEFRELVLRHFPRARFWAQRSLFGSFAAPDEAEIGFTEFRGDFAGIRSASALSDPVINLCFASEGELPVLGASLFEGMGVLEDVKERWRLEDELRKVRHELESTRNSRAYRLGRAITWPIRRLLGR